LVYFKSVYFKSTIHFSRYYNSWIEVEEAPESETSSNETKSSTTEEKQKSEVEDSLMQFNVVVEAPSILASGEDDGSWGSANSDISEQEENSFSSSSGEEEIPEAKHSSNTTESSEDIMFTRSIEESYIQFGGSLADVVGTCIISPSQPSSPSSPSQQFFLPLSPPSGNHNKRQPSSLSSL
jgi:hypothetical protein